MMHISYPIIDKCKHKYKHVLCIKCNECGRFDKKKVKKKKDKNMSCKCKDWKENIDKLNAGIVMLWTHGGKGYEGKPIIYCPWCGKKLEIIKENSNE